jgi:hypothetical protein
VIHVFSFLLQVVDYRNLKLLNQFLSDYNGEILSSQRTGKLSNCFGGSRGASFIFDPRAKYGLQG